MISSEVGIRVAQKSRAKKRDFPPLDILQKNKKLNIQKYIFSNQKLKKYERKKKNRIDDHQTTNFVV